MIVLIGAKRKIPMGSYSKLQIIMDYIKEGN